MTETEFKFVDSEELCKKHDMLYSILIGNMSNNNIMILNDLLEISRELTIRERK